MSVTDEDILEALKQQDFTALFEKHYSKIHKEALTNAAENKTEKANYTVGLRITLGFDAEQAEIKADLGISCPRKNILDTAAGEPLPIRAKDGVGKTELGLESEDKEGEE